MSTRRHDPVRARARPQRVLGASEQVAADIQHHIQTEGLRPGDFLGREEDLAARFGVSRPTLREALRMLSGGKLVRANKGPGGGIFIANTADGGMAQSLSDSIGMMLETGSARVSELLEVRLLLEVPLAGQAALHADSDTIARLHEAVEQGEATDPSDREALARVDAEVHRTIADSAGNRIMQALIEWVFEVLQPALMDNLHGAVVESAIVDQHREIVLSIERGDASRAERAMREHLTYLRDVLAMQDDRG